MNTEVAIETIIDYMEETLIEPRANWPRWIFQRRTYERWAAEELLILIADHPEMDPMNIMMAFISKMEMYRDFEGKASKMFKIAAEVGEDILLQFL